MVTGPVLKIGLEGDTKDESFDPSARVVEDDETTAEKEGKEGGNESGIDATTEEEVSKAFFIVSGVGSRGGKRTEGSKAGRDSEEGKEVTKDEKVDGEDEDGIEIESGMG